MSEDSGSWFWEGLPHEMTVGALRAVLSGVRSDLVVAPNMVRNLWLGTAEGEMLGYIDFCVYDFRGNDSTDDRICWSEGKEPSD